MSYHLPSRFCCAVMRDHSTLSCGIHLDPLECPDVLVTWSEVHGPGLPVRDGGSSFIVINHCPWCGSRISEEDHAKDD
jgi:hypothetical protein